MSKKCLCLLATLAVALPATRTALAATPISGVTYHYSPALLPNPDDGNGEWTWNFAGKDLAETKLTDGVLGSLAHIPDTETVAFTNGTWVGFNNDTGGEGHPRVDLNLGGSRQVKSVSVQYLIEAPPFIFAPQPVDFDPVGSIDVDAMTVFGSTDGVNYSSLASTNDFEPIFGPSGSIALNTVDARTVTFDFGPGGVAATHLRLDVRSPFTWVFLGEITISEVPEPASVSLAAAATLGCARSGLRRRRS